MQVPEVKVCGVTRQEDGQKAISLGASYLGFILFEASPRWIDPEEARGIWGKLDQGKARSVAVDVDPDPLRLAKIDSLGFDFFQLHFPSSTDPERVCQWSEIVGAERLWLAPKIPPSEPFPKQFLPFGDTFLQDTYSPDKFGGTGEVSDWQSFEILQSRFPFKKWVLAGGLAPENIFGALSATSANHIDLNSGIESEPGIKDQKKMEKAFSILHEQL